MSAQPQDALASQRFFFVTGKGGVGKTTTAAALALSLARRGKRVLVAMCGAHERLSSILGTPPIGHNIVKLVDNVWATKIQPERALEEYGELVIRVRTIARAVFDNKYTHAFFRAVPGLFDWAMLGKAWWHTTETRPDGSNRFDVVLFDAPSTGHGLDMLRIPKVILDIVPPGVLRRDAERAWALFRDPRRCGVVLVSLPEDMVCSETIELSTALRDELHMPIAMLVVNAMIEPMFSPEERAALLSDSALADQAWQLAGRSGSQPPPGDEATATLVAAARRAAREQSQARNLERLQRELGLRTTVLPRLLEGAGTPQGAEQLSTHL